MRGLEGKRIIVAGSARGIGAATARRLGEEGAKVLCGDVFVDKAELVARDIAAKGGTAVARFFDLHQEDSLTALITAAVAEFGGLDGIVNVAFEGRREYHERDVELLDMEPEIWATVLHANVIGTSLLMKYALPHLIDAGGGSIINITSGSAWVGEPIRVAYGASKAGINSITRHVANRYGDRNVRCNAVSPGAILTEAGKAIFSDAFKAQMLSGMPIKRLGEPEDIASTIAFLLSDDANWVTGQVWTVNGGLLLRE